MTEKQRENLLRRFFTAEFMVNMSSNEDDGMKTVGGVQDEGTQEEEEEEPNPLSSIHAIPHYVADKIWTESAELSVSAGSICPSPGCTDGNAWLVQSTNPSHRQPYYVECQKTGQIICEKGCALFHSCGICAHSVAVAKSKGCLSHFMLWLGKQKGSVNFSNLAGMDMPKNSGKKPQSHRKSSKKSTTKRIKKILANAGEKDHRPRIPISNPSALAHDQSQVTAIDSPCYSSGTCPHSTLPHSASDAGSSPLCPSLVPPMKATFHSHMPNSPASLSQAMSNAPFQCLPPPLIQSPLVQQVNMPVVYSPMQIAGEDSGSQEMCDTSGFFLQFVKGNISRCAGCGKRDLRGVDGKPHPPPDDLCLQHKEYVLFENPRTGAYQQSRDLRNVYYHANKMCVHPKYPNPHIVVSQDVKVKLLTIHINHIMCQFGLQVLNN